MRGGSRRAAGAAVVVAVVVMSAACSGAEAVTGPALPTFPAAPTSAVAGTAVDEGLLPDQCARILPVADLGALLGMPLDTVAVRTTIGVPAPSVGRVERIDCEYGGTAGGGTLLDVNAAAYTDAAAARKQWRTNAAVEDGDRRELPVGAASAVLVERPREAVLLVAYGSGTLTVVLPGGPPPAGTSREALLVDLAQRLLPALAVIAPEPEADVDQAAGAP